jgi:hypothetical protein
MRTPILFTVAALAAAVPAAAQQRTWQGFETAPRSGLAPAATLAADTIPVAHGETAAATPAPPAVRRAFMGLLGWPLGAVAGALVGRPLDTAGGEDPGLDGLIVGAAIGGAIGAGVAAGLADGAGECTTRHRMARGVLGSVAGTAVGLVAAGAARGDGVVLVIPVGSIVGAALAARC